MPNIWHVINCNLPFGTLLLIIIISLEWSLTSQFHQCTHIPPEPENVVHGVHIEPAHIMKKRSIDTSLRIRIFYDRSIYQLDADKFKLINESVLPEAVDFWQQALMVRQTLSPIRLSRRCSSGQVIYGEGRSHPYCNGECERTTLCGEVPVPEDHLDVCRSCTQDGRECQETGTAGAGIQGADFVFYISAMSTERCNRGLTVAYAAHCQQEVAMDRPIAGHANFCPDSISTKPQELEVLKSTVKHEILHALGFSISLFAYFRDSNGEPLGGELIKTRHHWRAAMKNWMGTEKIIKNVKRRDWKVRGGTITKTVQMMVTKGVVREVRNHFNCSLLEGAELEDQGGEGTALTHWEKRLFENEAMTGTHTQNPVYSRITLALMEDTGWYSANYSMAQPLSWGKNLGCDFVMKSCKDWMDNKLLQDLSNHPFCDKVKRDPLQTECTDDRSSVALCNLIEYSEELPPEYQNFDRVPHVSLGKEGFYGGAVSLSDYCPYIQEFTWRSQNIVVRGSHCQYPENNPQPDKNFALEEYGPDSKCFDHTDRMWEERTCKQVRQWLHWGSGCYRYHCQNGRLHIIVSNYTYACYYPGQVLAIRIMADGWLHKGTLVCPSCQEVCGEQLLLTNETCEDPPDFLPATASYHFDFLSCKSSLNVGSFLLLSQLTLGIIYSF